MSQEQGQGLEKLKEELQTRERLTLPLDPVKFCRRILKFYPTPYQTRFLIDLSKRIVLLWSRQSGKSRTIAAKAIWYSLSHPKTLFAKSRL
jgi:hypothetical protein